MKSLRNGRVGLTGPRLTSDATAKRLPPQAQQELDQAVREAIASKALSDTAAAYRDNPCRGDLETITGWVMHALDYRYDREVVQEAINRAVR